MKISLLLLPLFIALCAAVSKSHLKLRRSELQTAYEYSATCRAVGSTITLRAVVYSKVNQRVTFDNGQGITKTFEGSSPDGRASALGQEIVRIRQEVSTWTVTVESEIDGKWETSSISIARGSGTKMPDGTAVWTAQARYTPGTDLDVNVIILYK